MPQRRTPNTSVVLECIEDLHRQEQIASRETVAEATGLRIGLVDDRMKSLYQSGEIIRVQHGCYIPAHKHPPARLVSKTVLPCGTVKLDVGDDVLTLTPREARILASALAGEATQLVAINAAARDALNIATISNRLNELAKYVRELAGSIEQLENRLELEG